MVAVVTREPHDQAATVTNMTPNPAAVTDDLVVTLELLQHIRLLEQRLYATEQQRNDAERMIEDLEQTNDRQRRELEDRRRHALELGDCPPPKVVAEILWDRLRSWPRPHWQALVDHIRDFLSETRPYGQPDLRCASRAQARPTRA
jgi:hypothetical protein